MRKNSLKFREVKEKVKERETIEDLAKKGAQEMLRKALEAEVDGYLERERHRRSCCHRGYRNGYGKERHLSFCGGTIPVRVPRVSDVPQGQESFEPAVVQRYQRRSPMLDRQFRDLYREGLATRDFEPCFRLLLGETATLSPSTISRLTKEYQKEFEEFLKRDLSSERFYYLWADGIYLAAGQEDEKTALLVVMGVNEDGEKVLLGMREGYRESTESWKELLRDLKKRGLNTAALAVADGSLGFWGALSEIYPETRHQRCLKHKWVNVLDKLPKAKQKEALSHLREIYQARSRKEAVALTGKLAAQWKARYPRASECLTKDIEAMFTYFDFPKQHWIHLKTSNPIESAFAPVRLRTNAAKRLRTATGALYLVYKLIDRYSRSWRRINAPEKLQEVRLAGEERILTKAA
ncbi:MAG: hypothetical protein A3B79_05015 [Deltaproteobacteria bacterium RIFCSPHIGHO2_02_FULL_50_15]|nr:MAG: hypothetical protein A3B79_05015 [Deltaproteobacteria bacterium RIFCSPHIGHO2_02_FULL_50_15]